MPQETAAPEDSDDAILKEARARYERASQFADRNFRSYRDAMSFLAGNQWDDRLKRFREAAQRPVLVMDRLSTHVNQVVNDQRQSKPAIKVHPVDDRADVKTAEVYDGVIRSIERTSNAPMVYETASFTQVGGGLGGWRVLTRYVDEEAFEQELYLQRVLDPTAMLFDPDAKEMDGSDGKFAFYVEVKTRAAFEEEYPGVTPADWASANDPQGWWGVDTVRCAEYFRVVMKPTTLRLMMDGSTMDQASYDKALEGDPTLAEQVVSERPAKRREVQWFKLGGNSVLAKQTWPGKWIPLVRVVGNELVVQGEVLYSGLTQRAMDAQRMYNYQSSVMVEMLSLQKTAPFIAAEGQLKGPNKKRWANANTENPIVLEYTPVELNGNLAPPPQRQNAPQVPTGNVQAMQNAASDLQWITGQHAANFGAQSNETSGRAINARQREGDTATYHYLDNMSRGILHTGRILIDLIPKIYDTKRVLRIIGEDDSASSAMHDPTQKLAFQSMPTATGVQKIYNLNVGRYDVAVTVGPSYGTKRAEAVDAMAAILQANPNIAPVILDIFIRHQDWPGAQEMADRLRKTVPPNLLTDEESQNDPMAQVAQLQGAAQQLAQQLEQRTMALQQAQQLIQQAADEIQQLQAEKNERAAQSMDKTQSEKIKADAEKYRANADVEIARIQAAQELAESNAQKAQAEIAAMQEVLGGINERLQMIAQAASQPVQAGKQVEFQRGADGKIVGAIVMPMPETPQ